ncbi:MAG: PorT family protein [Hymenobacter sp.]|nr:MAG: PorT family protein [Hymenobacter sp.]
MMHRLLTGCSLFLGLCALAPQAWGQGTYRPGYIVQPTGDTIRGELQVRSAIRRAQLCRFRAAATGADVDYQPTQLRAYGLDGIAAYRSQLVPQRGTEAATVLFVKLLAVGRANLYAYQDREDVSRYYLAMGTDTLQTLRSFRVQKIVDNQEYFEEQSPFRTVLANALRACPSVQYLIPQLPLAEKDLTKLVTRYNECLDGPAAQVQLPRQHARLSVGVTAGVDATKVDFSSTLIRAYVARNVSTVEERAQTSFDVSYLRLPLQVRYHFNTGRFRPFLQAGGSMSFLLSHASQVQTEYTSASGKPVMTNYGSLLDNLFARSGFGLLIGAGLATPGIAGHAISLEVRGERSSGFLTDGASSPILHLGGLLSINLTK